MSLKADMRPASLSAVLGAPLFVESQMPGPAVSPASRDATASVTYHRVVMPNVQKLLKDALTLDPNDRAQLAARLLASLDDTEAEVEAAWALEIQRRAVEARQNPADDEDWRVVLDEIQREGLSR